MQYARQTHEWEEEQSDTDLPPTGETQHVDEDGPEFSSGPMPAAFSACLFLGLGLLICVILAVLL